jgi:hypothetical protein
MSAVRRDKNSSQDQAVYKGRSFAGAVSLRNGQWRALDANGLILGRFADRLEAVAAVLAKAVAGSTPETVRNNEKIEVKQRGRAP